jgi:uncharacterized membrane protein YhaH (DUF805 family)
VTPQPLNRAERRRMWWLYGLSLALDIAGVLWALAVFIAIAGFDRSFPNAAALLFAFVCLLALVAERIDAELLPLLERWVARG